MTVIDVETMRREEVATTEVGAHTFSLDRKRSASESVREIADMISRLVEAAHQTDEVSKSVATETRELLHDADTVKQKVDMFLAHVRAA